MTEREAKEVAEDLGLYAYKHSIFGWLVE